MNPETAKALMEWSDRMFYSLLMRNLSASEIKKLSDCHTTLQDRLIAEKNLPRQSRLGRTERPT